MTQAPDTHWAAIVTTPLQRIRAVREYANRVFDDEAVSATWLSRANRAIRGGLCAAGAACQDEEGFSETMAELARLERIARQQAEQLQTPQSPA